MEKLDSELLERVNLVFDQIEEYYDTFDEILDSASSNLERIITGSTGSDAEIHLKEHEKDKT